MIFNSENSLLDDIFFSQMNCNGKFAVEWSGNLIQFNRIGKLIPSRSSCSKIPQPMRRCSTSRTNDRWIILHRRHFIGGESLRSFVCHSDMRRFVECFESKIEKHPALCGYINHRGGVGWSMLLLWMNDVRFIWHPQWTRIRTIMHFEWMIFINNIFSLPFDSNVFVSAFQFYHPDRWIVPVRHSLRSAQHRQRYQNL